MPEDHGPGRGRIDPVPDYSLRPKASYGSETGDQWLVEPPSPLYKFLSSHGEPTNGGYGFVWSLPTKNPDGTWEPGEWCSVDGTLVACKNGLHLTTAEHLIRWLGPRLFEAEAEGGVIDAYDKVVARRVRLIREIESWDGASSSRYTPEVQVPKARFDAALATLIAEKRGPRHLLKLLSETLTDPTKVDERRLELQKQLAISGWKSRIETLENNIRRMEGKEPRRHAKGHGPRAASRRVSAALREVTAVWALAYPSFDTIAHVELGHKWFGVTKDYSSWVTHAWISPDIDYYSEKGRKIREEAHAKANQLRQEVIDAQPTPVYGDIPEDIVTALEKHGYGVKVKVA